MMVRAAEMTQMETKGRWRNCVAQDHRAQDPSGAAATQGLENEAIPMESLDDYEDEDGLEGPF